MKGVCHEIVLRDRNVEIAKGKALDMSQAANAARMHTLVSVAEDAAGIADSDVVVITAGSPRLPGERIPRVRSRFLRRERSSQTGHGLSESWPTGLLGQPTDRHRPTVHEHASVVVGGRRVR